ncbi:DUF5949 family protein [Streptomyces sp. NPDC094448]|uniref:DUF5949 family protein n=1 Tax=Streptomyces sp. NPDC094448 TaxID=3366063 RepID=UPI00380C5F1A
MTTANTATSAKNSVDRSHLGTLSVLAWTGDPEAGHDMPYLLVYSLGDGAGSAEEGEAALLGMIADCGAKAGDMSDATSASVTSPVRLLVEAGQAVLNMPHLSAQCPAPPEWLAAADGRGHAHVIIASRPWPEAKPGEQITEESLQTYLGDEETLLSSAHILVRVSQLRS